MQSPVVAPRRRWVTEVSADSEASDDARVAKRAAMRRATLHLVLSVIALDVVALAGYYLADLPHAAPRTRVSFTVVWMVLTALVVAVLLKRVRAARFSR